MPSRLTSKSPLRLFVSVAGLSVTGLKEPLVTGTLLYALTKGPTHIRERLLAPFTNNFLSTNSAARIASLVAILKALTAIGIAKRINSALNRFALNNWAFKRKGTPFNFDGAKSELVLITGGSSGFGYEMVKGFSKNARVAVLDISPFPSELAGLPDVHFYQCDLTDTSTVVSICADIKKAHGNPSVLVNNAGIGIGKSVLDTTNEECEKLFKVNLISHFVLIREFLPGMLEMKKGHIVTIASMASFIAAPGLLSYCCSKVAALYLNDGIRNECLSRYPGGESICTTSVHPSWHATGIIKGVEKALEAQGIIPDPPSKVSDLVVKQVLSARSGRIYAPLSEEGNAGLRNWPVWAQDLFIGNVFKWRGFEFGKDPGSTLSGQ